MLSRRQRISKAIARANPEWPMIFRRKQDLDVDWVLNTDEDVETKVAAGATDLNRREMLKTMGMGVMAPGMLMNMPGANLLKGFGSYLPQVAELLLREKVNPVWHGWGPDSGLKDGLEYALGSRKDSWWTTLLEEHGSPEAALQNVLGAKEGVTENFSGGDADTLWLTLIEKHGEDNAKKMFQALDQLPQEKLQEIVFSSPTVLKDIAKSGWWQPEIGEEVGAEILQKADVVRKNVIRTLRNIYPEQYKEFSDHELERSRIQQEYRNKQRAIERGEIEDDDDWDDDDDEVEEVSPQPVQQSQYSETFGPFDWEHGDQSRWSSHRTAAFILASEQISQAAILAPNGHIYEGVAHFDAWTKATEEMGDFDPAEEDMGFTTSDGRFVSREEAFQIAQLQNQYDPNPLFGIDEDETELDSSDVKHLREHPMRPSLTREYPIRRATLGPSPEGASNFTVPQAKLREMALHAEGFPIDHPAYGRVSDFHWAMEEKFRVSKIENPEDAMGGGIPVIVEGDVAGDDALGGDEYWIWYGDLKEGEELVPAIVGNRLPSGQDQNPQLGNKS